MTSDSQEISQLVHDFAAKLASDTLALGVQVTEPKEAGATLFSLRCSPKDESVLIGAAGAHVDSLACLVERAGLARGKEFILVLESTGARPEREPFEPKYADDHDPRSAHELLHRALDVMRLDGFKTEVTDRPVNGEPWLHFDFTVRLKSKTDAYKLLGKSGTGKRALISALGTLFRAMAMKQGIRYHLNIVEP